MRGRAKRRRSYPIGRRGAGIERYDRLRRQRATKLGIHPLRLHRLGRERFLGREPRLTLGAQGLGFAAPRLVARRAAAPGELVEQRAARFAGVGVDADRHRIVAADVPRLDVDLHDRGPGPNVAVVELGRELRQPRADREDQIRAAACGGGFRGAGPTERAEVERMRVGNRVVAAVRRDHRDPVAVTQLNDQLVGAGTAGAATDEQQRPLGAAEPLHRLANGLGVWRLRVRDAVAARRQRRRGRELLVQHVARDLDEHRAGPAAHRRAQGPAEELGDTLGLVDQERLLGHGPEHRDQVVFLERVFLIVIERDAADEDDHRRVGDMGRRDAGQEVRRPGTARHEADARSVRDARQAVGHERRGLLVAHVDVLDALIVVEPVEDVQKGRADDSEYVTDALGLQELDDRSPACPLVHRGAPPARGASRRVMGPAARHRIPAGAP